MSGFNLRGYNILPLDVPLHISALEEEFFKIVTKTDDWESLKSHITKIQSEAYESIYAYPCIRSFNFCRFKVASHFAYPVVKKLGLEDHSIFLDLGCCFGTDVRKVALDGWSSGRVVGTDLQAGFIELGYKLFLDAETCSIPFLVGDIFSSTFYDSTSTTTPGIPSPPLLKSLTPLRSKVRALHAGSFFHLFDETSQENLAYIVLSLMDQKPGSTVFGSHVSQEVAGMKSNNRGTDKVTSRGMYCHSPTSWVELWKKVAGDKVVVDARLMSRNESQLAPPSADNDAKGGELMLWSVTWL